MGSTAGGQHVAWIQEIKRLADEHSNARCSGSPSRQVTQNTLWSLNSGRQTVHIQPQLSSKWATLNQLHGCYEPKTFFARAMQRPGSPASHTPHCLALRDGEEPADETTPRPRGLRNTPNAFFLLCSSGTKPSGIAATALSPPAPRFTPSLTPWVVCAALPVAWFYSACALHTGTGQQVKEGLAINPEI